MELKLQEKIKAAIEIDGNIIINMENSQVFAHIADDQAFFYIKSNDGKEVKLRFIKAI
jgi:hypothetical protein